MAVVSKMDREIYYSLRSTDLQRLFKIWGNIETLRTERRKGLKKVETPTLDSCQILVRERQRNGERQSLVWKSS